MGKQVVLKSPEEATVDEVTLVKNDTENPAELTNDQIKRLEAAGAKVEVLEKGEDPINALTGQDLDKAVKDSGITGLPGNATAEDKRAALKAVRDKDKNGGDA